MACALPQPPAPRYRTLLRVRLAPLFILAAAGFVLAAEYAPLWATLLVGIAASAALWAVAVLPGMYAARMYITRYSDCVKLERGVFLREIVLVPNAQIIAVRLRRTPVERLFGLSALMLVTPAGRVRLPGLTAERARELRGLLAVGRGRG